MSSSVALPQIFSSPESLIGEISFYLTPLSLHLFRMDQAASIFGVPNHALHISFYPKLKAIPTRLPDSDPSHAWVIANTLVVSDKKVSEVYDSREKKVIFSFPISFLFIENLNLIPFRLLLLSPSGLWSSSIQSKSSRIINGSLYFI